MFNFRVFLKGLAFAWLFVFCVCFPFGLLLAFLLGEPTELILMEVAVLGASMIFASVAGAIYIWMVDR